MTKQPPKDLESQPKQKPDTNDADSVVKFLREAASLLGKTEDSVIADYKAMRAILKQNRRKEAPND
jgi:hypothetical protein